MEDLFMGYVEAYDTGIFIGLIIVVIIIIAIIAYKAHLRANTERIWQQRVNDVTKNRKSFYKELEKENFNAKVDFSFANYYRTAEPIEIMAFKADLDKKKLAIGALAESWTAPQSDTTMPP